MHFKRDRKDMYSVIKYFFLKINTVLLHFLFIKTILGKTYQS